MWRGALLAAAAVSCTLPTHAHAHRSPRLAHIQDLICVLILSGLQKEDLDVSMLSKLQRYNVNLDVINNEKTRQQCTSRDNGFRKSDKNEIQEVLVTTTEYSTTISSKNPLAANNLDMASVMEYLKTRQGSIINITTDQTSIYEETVTHVTALPENQSKIDMDSLQRLLQVETEEKSLHKKDDDSKTTEHAEGTDLKLNQKNLISTDVNTIINKLVKDYLLEKQKLLTTTERTTTRFTIDIQNIYKQIDEIIANRSNVDNKNLKTEKKYQENIVQSNIKQNFNTPDLVTLSNPSKPYSTGKQLFDTFYTFLSEMNQSKINATRPYPSYDYNAHYKDSPQVNKVLEALNKKDQENKRESTTFKSKFEKDPDASALAPTLVKEIAETVKNVIIKDLRNEFPDIYLKTTTKNTPTTLSTLTTTTEKIPSKAVTKRIQDKDAAIIDKVMDLYEEIKSLKQATYSLRVSNESTVFVNKLNGPNHTQRNSPMIMRTANLSPIQEPKRLISPIDYHPRPYLNYNAHIPRRETKRLPITIQTNSVEIQPLVVAVSKPESMIRQNIVVHTGNRYQHRNRNNNNFKYLNSGARFTDLDAPISHQNKTYNNYKPVKRNNEHNAARIIQEQKQRDDIIRFRLSDIGNSRLDTDYYEKINFVNKNDGKENHGIFNNKYPRFHERLERVDAGSDGTPVVSDVDMKYKNIQNSDFPSRHQLSLVDMKKGTPYDDTHFKNFIKTQQKVTDILERILATRPRSNTPRSVEAV